MSTKIEWADEVWNPVTGCTKVSAGCANCYAERIAQRFTRIGRYDRPGVCWPVYDTNDFTDILLHLDSLDQPLRWRKPRRAFVCSMGDLFHEDVPDEFIAEVFAVMAMVRTSGHQFLILTKRPKRMLAWLSQEKARAHVSAAMDAIYYLPENGRSYQRWLTIWPLPHVWLGVSVEDQKTADERIPLLLQTPAAVRFVSCEPLLGPVNLHPWTTGPASQARAIDRSIDYALAMGGSEPDDDFGPAPPDPRPDWVICGGESGPGARPMHPDWARSLRDQCKAAGVPFFFKQWGEWTSFYDLPEADEPSWSPGRRSLACKPHEYIGINGGASSSGPRHPTDCRMVRVGKKAAGNLLDGVKHEEFPEVPR